MMWKRLPTIMAVLAIGAAILAVLWVLGFDLTWWIYGYAALVLCLLLNVIVWARIAARGGAAGPPPISTRLLLEAVLRAARPVEEALLSQDRPGTPEPAIRADRWHDLALDCAQALVLARFGERTRPGLAAAESLRLEPHVERLKRRPGAPGVAAEVTGDDLAPPAWLAAGDLEGADEEPLDSVAGTSARWQSILSAAAGPGPDWAMVLQRALNRADEVLDTGH